jgi:hypothetical protein
VKLMKTALCWGIKYRTVAIPFRLFETDRFSSYSNQYNVPPLETSMSKERVEGAFSVGPDRPCCFRSMERSSLFVREKFDDSQKHCNNVYVCVCSTATGCQPNCSYIQGAPETVN